MLLRFPTGVSVEQAKKDAKRLAKAEGLPHHEALDRVARQNSNNAWDWARAMEILPWAEEQGLNALAAQFKAEAVVPVGSDEKGRISYTTAGVAATAIARILPEKRGASFKGIPEDDDLLPLRGLGAMGLPGIELSEEVIHAFESLFQPVRGIIAWHRQCIQQTFWADLWKQVEEEGFLDEDGGDELEAAKRHFQLCKQKMAAMGQPYPHIDIALMRREGFQTLADDLESDKFTPGLMEHIRAWKVGNYDNLS